MELPLALQAWQLGVSVLCGVGLGLYYDLLRAPRRVHPRLTPLFDLLFVLTLPVVFLALALYVGRGRLRIFLLVGLGIGASAYFLTLSRAFLPLLTVLLRRLHRHLARFVRFQGKILKNFGVFCKKTVAFFEKSVIIKDRVKSRRKRQRRRTRCGLRKHPSGSS